PVTKVRTASKSTGGSYERTTSCCGAPSDRLLEPPPGWAVYSSRLPAVTRSREAPAGIGRPAGVDDRTNADADVDARSHHDTARSRLRMAVVGLRGLRPRRRRRFRGVPADRRRGARGWSGRGVGAGGRGDGGGRAVGPAARAVGGDAPQAAGHDRRRPAALP